MDAPQRATAGGRWWTRIGVLTASLVLAAIGAFAAEDNDDVQSSTTAVARAAVLTPETGSITAATPAVVPAVSRDFDAVRAVDHAGRSRVYDLVMIGDSLTHAAHPALQTALVGAGWRPLVDGVASRSISYPADVTFSGVDRVEEIQASGVDPTTWLVELGTNDLYFVEHCQCADKRAAATERIRMMLAAIGPDHAVHWVGVQNYEYPATNALFNDVLAGMVSSGEISGLVDWASVSSGHREDYFVDQAHLSDAGSAVWVAAIAAAVT